MMRCLRNGGRRGPLFFNSSWYGWVMDTSRAVIGRVQQITAGMKHPAVIAVVLEILLLWVVAVIGVLLLV